MSLSTQGWVTVRNSQEPLLYVSLTDLFHATVFRDKTVKSPI